MQEGLIIEEGVKTLPAELVILDPIGGNERGTDCSFTADP